MKENQPQTSDDCGCAPGHCSPTLSGRREFIKTSSLASALLLPGHLQAMAGPFTKKDLSDHLIPEDKKLNRQWLDALTRRGSAEVFTGDELAYIGMPIGGIGCGQLYLGGDGRLWLWDIFKANYTREKHGQILTTMSQGGHYAKPVPFGGSYTERNGADVEQGFAMRVRAGEKTQVRTLDKNGFPSVSFRGEYPVGRVTYKAADFPVCTELEAFSPFIPLNERDSALPVTVMRHTVTNTSDDTLQVDIGGWLQNAVCPYTQDASLGQRTNTVLSEQGDKRCMSILSTIGGLEEIKQYHGYGSCALTFIEDGESQVRGVAELSNWQEADKFFTEVAATKDAPASKPLNEVLVGGLSASTELKPGESKVFTFLVSWYFPFHQGERRENVGRTFTARHYRDWFESAANVAGYVADKKEELISGTLLWNKTWYDSSLPHWFLDRSIIPLDCTATQMFHWFEDGIPWAWEGVDCCGGTCTHVFHYAQAMGRIFPDLERRCREKTDYGSAFDQNSGGIGYRGSAGQKTAVDGQAGSILRVYREHQMSADDAFLKRLWPKVKRSIEFLMTFDKDEDGIITGAQRHTLDAAWNGKISWTSSMYLGALAAGEAMAKEQGDDAFAQKCRDIIDRGQQNIVKELFDGEYFIHKPDEPIGKRLNTNIGCHIDQVLGQAWMSQVGLGRVLPKQETVSALESLWKYNFAPDAGGYALRHREIEKTFRWYAMPGEAGLLMTTWPKGGAKDAIPGDELRTEDNPNKWTGPGGYFNECMNGFEYQVAWHMVAEGEADGALVEKGLAIMTAMVRPSETLTMRSNARTTMRGQWLHMESCWPPVATLITAPKE